MAEQFPDRPIVDGGVWSLPPSQINFPQLDELLKMVSRSMEIIDQARTEIRLAAMDMKRNRPSKFPLLNQLISEISDVSSLADLKAENERLLIQLGKFVGLAVECGWTGDETNAADALAKWVEDKKTFTDLVAVEIETLCKKVDRIERVKNAIGNDVDQIQ